MKASFFTLALLLGSLCSSHAMELNFTNARVTFNPSQKFFQVQKQNQPSTMISVIPGECAKFLQVEIRDSVLSIDTGKFFSNGGKEVYLHQFRHTWSDPGSREGRFSAEMAASPDGSKIKLVFHGKNFWKEKIFPLNSSWGKPDLQEKYPAGLKSVYTRIHLLSPGVYRIRSMSLQESGEKQP